MSLSVILPSTTDAGVITYTAADGTVFKSQTNKLRFTASKSYCEGLSLKVASIRSLTENNALYAAFVYVNYCVLL